MADQKKVKVIVIGGGASGLVAAINAARKNADVTILEKGNRVGRKILATGNGRCNLTNTDIDLSYYHGKHPEFVYGPFSRLDYFGTIDFFENLGIAIKIEDGGKVYPASLQASSVLDVLRYEAQSLGVEVICDADVVNIDKNNKFKITIRDGRQFIGDKVILSTGGKSSPNLGSDGYGYKLAQGFGHTIVEPFPALVQLKLKSDFLKQIQGVKFDGTAQIVVDGKVKRQERGEILFTDYGISGPPIMQLSRTAIESLKNGEKVFIRVIIIDDMAFNELDEIIAKRLSIGKDKTLAFNFVGFLNKRLIPVILKTAGITDINKKSREISNKDRKNIVSVLKDWKFEVTGHNTWSFAQVTAGGVNVDEIDGRSMESKMVPGLYFAGEIVDIDGDCGGFNLQWAWSSGFVAGESASTD